LNEVEYDIKNYQERDLSFPWKPKAEVDNTNRGLDNSRYHTKLRKPNPIIVLLYIQKLERKQSHFDYAFKNMEFRTLFSKQWTAPGLGNHGVQ
jgi:hypothetical protein